MMGGIIGGKLPEIVYAGHDFLTGNNSQYTLGAVPLGTEHLRRAVLLFTGSNFLVGGAGKTIINLTVDGVSATKISTFDGGKTWWAINKPTGTTAEVVYETSDGTNLLFGAVHCFACYHLKSLSPIDVGTTFSGLGNFSITEDIDVTSHAVIALAGDGIAGGTGGPFTWTNAVEDVDEAGYSGTGAGSEYTFAHVQDAVAPTHQVDMATGDECSLYWVSLR